MERLASREIAATRRRFVVQVTLDAIHVPLWAVERRVKGLSRSASRIWLRPRDAHFLARLDREFHFNESGNSEILHQWLFMAVRGAYSPARPRLHGRGLRRDVPPQ